MQLSFIKHMAITIFVASFFIVSVSTSCFAATFDLGNGFSDHGVAVPLSSHRGTVATVDGQGRNVVLSWLFDHRGGYALLMIEADTGKSEQFQIPFTTSDGPFSSILSSSNKFYTHFSSYFCEFDPAKRAFTFFQKTTPKMAMSMTEDDNGLIWSVTYPNSGIVSFNPKTRILSDFGAVHKENWAQYPRSTALDDSGWLYFGIGPRNSKIIAFDSITGKAKTMLPELARDKDYAFVYRDINGKVYGQLSKSAQSDWYEFYRGKGRNIGKHIKRRPKKIISSNQNLFYGVFPDGKILKSFDLTSRFFTIEDPKIKLSRKINFDYDTYGATLMNVVTVQNGTISGGSYFPHFFFNYNPKTDAWLRHKSYGQWNTMARQDSRIFIGGYSAGFLLEWNPKRAWVTTAKGKYDSNPRYLTQSDRTINRPHKLFAHPDGRWIIMAGTPGYGDTGGGLLFWDTKTAKSELIKDTGIIPEQSTVSVVAIEKNKLLGGTTTTPGTGGEKKAKEAVLYIMDIETKKIDWQQVFIPGAQSYTDMICGKNGLVFGIIDRRRFFVFDSVQRKLVYDKYLANKYGMFAGSQQGPRIFVPAPDGSIYVLFIKGIGRLDQDNYNIEMLAQSPVPIVQGGDYLDEKIYFSNGSHLYSYSISH